MPTPSSPSASQFFSNSIFWIEVEKIKPNPFQPRRDFDEAALRDLAESIRMYGVLQPLVVTRKERATPEGGMAVEYELISGERRLRASKLAGLIQVPALIRAVEDDDRTKLELAIIENLQREDLNPVDRARSFQRLAEEFGLKHVQIAEKVGKSREYVSNSLRLLSLPAEMLDAVSAGRISEGHTRPLMMLNDRPEEQAVLFKEIVWKRLTVREAESIARRIAVDRVRKKERAFNPEMLEMEEKFRETLGTRVQIETRAPGPDGRPAGGKIVIDFSSADDVRHILDMIHGQAVAAAASLEAPAASAVPTASAALAAPVVPAAAPASAPALVPEAAPSAQSALSASAIAPAEAPVETTAAAAPIAPEAPAAPAVPEAPVDDRSADEKKSDDDDLYSVKNFVV